MNSQSTDAARMRESPAHDPRFVIRRFGDDAEQIVRFFLFKDVIEELTFSSNYAHEDGEICVAILTGGFGVHGERGFVEVTGFTGMQVVKDLSQLYEAVRTQADEYIASSPVDPMVGLFVGLAGSQGRLHPEIARVHFSLFNVPFQPAVVHDPEASLLGVSSRAPREAFFNAAFRVVGVQRALSLKPRPERGTAHAASVGTHNGDSEE